MWNTPTKVASGVNTSVEARDCTKNPRNKSVELLRMTVEENRMLQCTDTNALATLACMVFTAAVSPEVRLCV